ncbi:MFS general substrate transporter [Hypoxylon cercidicola]|nr:MFS general substrate transporter [Hypoxylon cercidicola]
MELSSSQTRPISKEGLVEPLRIDDSQIRCRESSDLVYEQGRQPENTLPETPPAEPEEQEYAQGWRLFLILSALLLSIFCQALDDTIIATAIPRITDDFKRLDDAGWYGSAYLLTNAAFQLFYGKLYQILPLRLVFLCALLLFEAGSLVAALAPTSAVLIAGRAIAGTGAAGITSGALNIIAHTTPVHRRPFFVSLIGAVYGVASAIGPILGGALAEKVTWRWNFYLNLPIGGATAIVLLLVLRRLPPSAQGHRLPIRTAIARLDPIGTFTFIPSIACLLTALQWGGTTYPWSDGRIAALLTVFAVLLVAFVLAQVVQDDRNVTVPKHIARNRDMAFGALFSFCQGAAFNLYIFSIPLYFQAVKNATPIASGVDYLPLILGNAVFIFVAGLLTAKIGTNVPWVWASSVLMAVGAGLLTLLRPDSDPGRWIGYQLLFAIGSGLGFQQPFVTAQAVLPLDDIGPGTGIMMLANLGGAAIFVSVSLSVFAENLVSGVAALGLDGVDPHSIVQLGATELRQLVPSQDVDQVVVAYNTALIRAYQVGLVLSCISVIGPAGMRWVPLKKKGD